MISNKQHRGTDAQQHRKSALCFSAALLLCCSLLVGCHREDKKTAAELTGGDVDRGHAAIESYGCGSCHTIPGVKGANGAVGPPLTGIADRTYLAGQVPNNPTNMMKWIQNPQSVENNTAMPNLGVSNAEAKDIAAYLYTLRK